MYTYHPRNSVQVPPRPQSQNYLASQLPPQKPPSRPPSYAQNQSFVKKSPSKPAPEQSYRKYQQKMKTLGKVRYINQLAQMEYQDKLTQVHSRYSSKTKQSVQNKLKAKNQMAQFIDEEDQFGQQFQELMQYKYGASKNKGYHFQRQSSQKQEYSFCSLCDQIHTKSQQEHQKLCRYQQYARSKYYVQESLDRIIESLSRLNSQQSQQLIYLTKRIKKKEDVSQELIDMMPILKNDEVLGKIAGKLKRIIQEN